MLTLHHTYTFEEAIKGWSTDPFEVLCDSQFAVFPDAILCFFTTNADLLKTHLVSLKGLLWTPARLDYDPPDHIPWLPTKAREVYYFNGESKMLRFHQLLIRADVNAPFIYAGQVRLASYGSSNAPPRQFATFGLYNELPHNTWLQLGGK